LLVSGGVSTLTASSIYSYFLVVVTSLMVAYPVSRFYGKKAKKGSVTTDNHSRLSPTPLILFSRLSPTL